jgi:hypothetical protein
MNFWAFRGKYAEAYWLFECVSTHFSNSSLEIHFEAVADEAEA